MILMTTPSWSKGSAARALKQYSFRKNRKGDDFDVWSRKDGDVVYVPNPSLSLNDVEQGAKQIEGIFEPNPRTYLDPSGWHVFNLGPEMGYAVVAPYKKGTIVAFRRQYPGAYPLILARWRHLRSDPFIQRYRSRSAATRALKRFVCRKCRKKYGRLERGGMLCT